MARTVTFQRVRDGVWTRTGGDPSVQNNLQTNAAYAITEYINEAYKTAWQFYEWPDALTVEQRTFSSQLVEWEQSGQTAIETMIGLHQDDPRKNDYARPVAWRTAPEGIYVDKAFESATLWFTYRAPAPWFTAAEYANSTSYAIGDRVYYGTTGECYINIQAGTGNLPTDTDYWTKLDFLAILEAPVKQGARSEWLREEGQDATSTLAEEKMYSLLEDEILRLETQQGDTRRARHLAA